MASVNEMVARELRSVIEDQLGDEVYEVGSDIPVPIGLALDPEATPGVDRLLCAAASWDLLKQACVVINAGTAVSIDFIDGEGVFQRRSDRTRGADATGSDAYGYRCPSAI